MENVISLNKDIDEKLSFQEERNRNEYSNTVAKVVDNSIGYIIKALPVNENIKQIALDVKDAFKTGDFKEIVKTAVKSSIKEGLEILNLPKNVISDISKISKIAFSGGLSSALSAGIDIISKKYLKNNIFSSVLFKITNEMKNYVFSKDFKIKIDNNINKLLEKNNKFNDLCQKWYESYEKFDLFNMNSLCKSIKNMQKHIVNDKDCKIQSDIIENMTNLINTKNSKLSPIQMQICNNI